MEKLCIDIKTKCVFRVCGKYCMQNLSCYISKEKGRCEFAIISHGKSGVYDKSRIKIK